ncbi:ADP-ribose pyrophosphatase [mine drainage metagenome]|uniref:ADP-ribose pyrophosphatase n=1 Tax=mine drainage metagenome TaxID=410659 RepID=A0A1J5PZJ5_9ZZZZ
MTKGKGTGGGDFQIEVVDRRLACENTKFFVYFDHVIDKTGDEVRDYLVVAPKNTGRNLVTGVAILPIVNGQVGLIRIYRPAIRDYSWEIPHGFVDEGESDHSSALRELLEETGLTVESRSFSSMGYITPDTGVLAARVHLFLAESGHATQKIQPELGLREFRFFPFVEFEEMIKCSEIQDTFTLAAWCKYQLFQNIRQADRHAP